LLSITIHVGEILFTDHDPHALTGPIASIESVAVVGGAALVLALAIAVPLAGDSRRARIGAVVLGSLTVVSTARVLVGCSGDTRRCDRLARRPGERKPPSDRHCPGFGIFGIVIAILVIVATMFGGIAGAVLD
jgi:hypothetical protein